MGYYLRVFCASDELPPLAQALERLSEEGIELRLDAEHSAKNADAADWRDAAVLDAASKRAFVVEATRAEEDDLVADEIQEFLDLLEDVPDSPEKARVADHLRRTRAVVAAQVLGGADDDGLEAAVSFLSFFAERCDGLIQADGTGFFEGDELIVEVD